MSSQNPGVSAAGKAAGRTALNPAAGPAAIGGMLQVGGDVDSDSSDIDLTEVRSRLAKAVSDITRLANAMEALAVGAIRGATETSGDEHMPEIGAYPTVNEHRQEAS